MPLKPLKPGTYEAVVESFKVRKVRNKPLYKVKFTFANVKKVKNKKVDKIEWH